MNLGVFPSLQFLRIIWGQVCVLLWMFDKTHLWSHPVQDFCLSGVGFVFQSSPKITFLLSLEREEGRWGGGKREKWEAFISCLPYTPLLGIEPTTFWCGGQCSSELSHPARAVGSWLLLRFHWLWVVCSDFLFLFYSVLEDGVFLEMYPFCPDFPICWHVVAHNIFL